MKDDLFDKLLQQKTGSHEAPVPADAWANISKKKKKKRYVAWWWFTGVILLAGISIGGYFQMNKKDQVIVSTLKTTEEIKKIDTERNNLIVQKNDKNSIVSNETTFTPPQKDLSSGIPSVAKNEISFLDENQSQTGIAKKSKRAGRSLISIDNSSSITDNETTYTNKPSSGKNTGHSIMTIRNATVASEGNGEENLKKNTLSPIVNSETIADGQDSLSSVVQDDSKEKDSTISVIAKVDLLQTTPEKSTENILFEKKKVVPAKKTNGFYAELSFTPYKAFYKNDPLVSVKRITVTPMRKSEFTATDIRSSTEAAFAYTIALRKNIHKRLALGTGLQYSFIKENVRLSGLEISTSFNIVKRLNANNGNPFLFDDTVSTSSSGKRTILATNSYNLVSIPLLLHYDLMTSKNWAFSFVGGTYLNVSTKYDNSISGEFEPVYSNGERGGKSDNKFTADIFAGLHFTRRMGSRYFLFAEPGFRYSLMKYDMQQVVNNKYIHRAGISFGATWKPGK